MASASAERSGAPGTLTPHAKPIISVEEWEAKAPLGGSEARSVNLIKGAAEKAALPLKVYRAIAPYSSWLNDHKSVCGR